MAVRSIDVASQPGALSMSSMDARMAQDRLDAQVGTVAQGDPVSQTAAATRTAIQAAQAADAAVASATEIAKGYANAATAALAKNDRHDAGVNIVRHLDAMRTVVQQYGKSVKAKLIAVDMGQAAQLAQQAMTAIEQAGKLRIAGHTADAVALDSKALALKAQAASYRTGAKALSERPIQIQLPPNLTDEHIATVGARYDLRVRRRLGMEAEWQRVGSTMQTPGLGVMPEIVERFASVSGEYGGGPIGHLFAAAELGQVSALRSGFGALNGFWDQLGSAVGNTLGIDTKTLGHTFNNI